MASEQPGPVASPDGADATSFTLQIVSPSVNVPQPLALQGLPFDLTVRQLKERIRNVISTKPTDQAQRLIHRGRLLARDTETMVDVFGQEALQSADPQSLHLVLRDLSDGRPAATPSPLHTASQGPPSGQQATATQIPQQHQHPNPHQPQHQFLNPGNHIQQVRIGVPYYQTIAFGLPQVPMAGMPGMPPPNQPMNVPSGTPPNPHSQWMRTMSTHMNQRPTAAGQEIPTTSTGGAPETSTQGRTASPHRPDGTRTTVRETTGPNGLHWRITVNESFANPLQGPARSGSPFSTADAANHWGAQPRSVPNGGQLSNHDVQAMLRAADTSAAATRVMTNAMRRNASSSSLASLSASQAHHPIPPGVTTPLMPSRAGSATGTPDPPRAQGRTRSPLVNQHQAQSSQGTPEVYILSSPTGPRALLLNSSSLDSYFTPTLRPRLSRPAFANAINRQRLIPTPTTSHSPQSPVGRPNAQANDTPQLQPQPQLQQLGLPQPPLGQPQGQPQIGHAVARPDNPQIQAIRLAQIWPHFLMIIRLGIFIWAFTSPNSSWTRWITVISIAIVLFFANAGVFNPIAERVWTPFRRHLENLIPLADPAPRRRFGRVGQAAGGENVGGANGEGAEPAQQGELNPADTAARLVQQRRIENGNWLMDQARRLERAGILFLASIAPGVAERHIAHLEAEVRAERRRREAEAEAEAAAAAAAQSDSNRQESAEEGQAGTGDSNEPTASGAMESGEQRATQEQADNERRAAEQEPLIAV